ncbi:permease [Legionella norrlandica]|uniref:Lipopolysaccharide export system permease protein LptF n=1 Tax=Legionella norrlandica TaxID=1498499 RepID=A0A0A2SST9_9GAMM|nr:LPS export ABC transporter permease LptF [Legionella norrlandica]KGP64200.1 permease [Legionella norrlandica]
MIIFRYLAKEVFLTLIALTAILVLIFMSNQFIQYLNRAASGSIPGFIIMKLMMLELPNLMGLLLPLGFYVALLLAYGRLYAESEMTILRACGYGPKQLLMHSFIMASIVLVIVGAVMIWASPVIAVERTKLIRSTGIKTLIQTIMPGRFHAINSGQQIFYVQAMNRDHSQAEQIFMAKHTVQGNQLLWDILWADKAFAKANPKTGEEYIVLENGKEYQGIPGHADYQIAEFASYQSKLPHPTVVMNDDARTAKTSTLWPFNNPDLKKAAELQWRVSIPLMVLTLTLVAVPLSRVNPRSGKYSKLLPAIIIYIFYANFIFVSRDAIATGKIPWWIGMWWVHLVIAILGIVFIWRNQVKLA